jgi:hypothetical protein
LTTLSPLERGLDIKELFFRKNYFKKTPPLCEAERGLGGESTARGYLTHPVFASLDHPLSFGKRVFNYFFKRALFTK